MKYKTAELEGELLDVAVLLAQDIHLIDAFDHRGELRQPSTRWDHGGPIIERERISVEYWVLIGERYWGAGLKDEDGHELPDLNPAKHAVMASGWCPVMATGTTPLIAAMRAYVASKFGDEIELP